MRSLGFPQRESERLILMPNADEWCREIDDLLFGEAAARSRPVPEEEVDETSLGDGDVAIDEVDGALFGTPASTMSTATEVEQRLVEPHVTAPVDVELEHPEEQVVTTPVPVFGEGAAYSRPPPAEEVRESALADGDAAIDSPDPALFGTPASSASTATEVEQRRVNPAVAASVDVELEPPEAREHRQEADTFQEEPTSPVPMGMIFGTVPVGVEFELPPEEVPTAPVPVPVPMTFDEGEPAAVAPESSDERDAPVAAGNDRGRWRVWLVGGLALAVVIGVTLGALALTRSDGPQPAVRTDSKSPTTTATTTSTTTVATTTPPAPETSAPAASPPTPPRAPAASTTATAPPSAHPGPTTRPPSAGLPGAAPANPTPPRPALPPPLAPPEPPPPPPAPTSPPPPPPPTSPAPTLPLPSLPTGL
jgi:hypothetical protein